MTTEISKELSTIGDKIREKVKNSILEAISDDMLQQLIKQQYDQFFKEKRDRYDNAQPSDFSMLVKEIITTEIRSSITASMRECFSQTEIEWDGNGYKMIGDLVKQMAPVAMQSIMEGIASNCLQAIKSNSY